MKNNILIVLEKLGIGGVETFVLNQVKALSKNNNVYVLAKNDIFSEKFEEYGAKIIDYEFLDCIYYDKEKIQDIVNIINKYKITEVHINQFPTVNVVMPACILTNTPYVSYLHLASGLINDPSKNAYDYFERQFITYKKSFDILFKNSYKIVAITENIKNYTANRYNIDKNKIVVIPNSIDIEEFSSNRKVTNVKKIFLISRLSDVKETSIINGLNLYKKIKEKKDVSLTIAGDGPIRNQIEEYVEQNNIKDVKFLGSITNVKEVMDEHDLVIGLDRCILESLSLSKLAVISGYDGLKGLVTKSNLDKCISENFSGHNMETRSLEEVTESIINLDKKSIKEIINSNTKIIRDKLDINKNISILGDVDYKVDKNEVIKDLLEITEILGKSQIEYFNKAEEIWKNYEYYKKETTRKYEKIDKISKLIKLPFRKLKNILKGQKK